MMKTPLVIISNLYPLPWQPTRATFNFQQFSLLADEFDIHILLPVAFPDWFKHRKLIDRSNTRVKIVPYLYLPKFGRRFYSTLMYYSLKMTAWHWLKNIKPEKILASWAFPDGVAAQKLAKKLQCEFYLKVHGSDINMHTLYPARAKQITRMANQAKGILSVSQDLANKMTDLGVDPKLINVIYNGVNLDKFVPIKDNTLTPYVLFIGNLKKEKGVLELLQAFALIHKKFPKLTLKYIGSGNMLSELKSFANSEGITKYVDFDGVKPHDQLPEILANAEVLSLPSYNEGVPNVILESMACGVPVVASTVGGIPEVLPSSCGLLAKEITPEAIAEQLTIALSHHWDKAQIRAHAEQFNWQKNITQLTTLLSNSPNNTNK